MLTLKGSRLNLYLSLKGELCVHINADERTIHVQGIYGRLGARFQLVKLNVSGLFSLSFPILSV